MSRKPKSSAGDGGGGSRRRDLFVGFVTGIIVAFVLLNIIEKQKFTSLLLDIQQQAYSNRPPCDCSDSSTTETGTSDAAAGVPKALEAAPQLQAERLQIDGMQSPMELSRQPDFYDIASKTGTDKVRGAVLLPNCLKDIQRCREPEMVNPRCRVGHQHFYHTLYNRWLRPTYTDPNAEPFQFLEIGFFNGQGFDAYKEFLSDKAETHSMEIACLPKGPREEGKWPWGNFASKNPRYEHYLNTSQLHCGDASDFKYLHHTWTTQMKRPDAPPLKVVIDDASHLADHMAKSLFFWFPRIEPGGLMIVEDIQPISLSNNFRLHVLPQVIKDLHYCGGTEVKDKACFPTIWPLLHSVHCEMHICVFQRNDQPSVEYNETFSMPPPNALKGGQCLFP